PGEGRRASRIGALVVGVHDETDPPSPLRYAGRVGTGFTDRTLDELRERLEPLRTDHSPFGHHPPGLPRTVRSVTPSPLAAVEYGEWTSDGLLRHPSFKGLREDKDPADVVRELPGDARELAFGERTVRVSNWSKVLWPQAGFTKGDLVEYYVAVAPTLLPHLA